MQDNYTNRDRIRLIGSDTLPPEELSNLGNTSTRTQGSNVYENFGKLAEKVDKLEKKKVIEVNFENGVICALVALCLVIFGWVLLDKFSLVKELNCKNNVLVECYDKCSLRQVNEKQNECEDKF